MTPEKMTLETIFSKAGIEGVTTVNCDWIDSTSLAVRGFPGKAIGHSAKPDGGWLIPGTWWVDETLLIFEKQVWQGAVALWKGRTLTWEEGGLRLIVLVPGTVSVTSVQPDRFWYEELPRIGGAPPDFPLRQRYARLLGREGRWTELSWSCPSTNGLQFNRTWDRGNIIDQDADHPLIAVWPPVDIPDWKLYSILIQGLRVVEVDSPDRGFRVAVSLGKEADPSTFTDANQVKLQPVEGRPDIVGIYSTLGGPRALFLYDELDRCGGGIRLLKESASRAPGDDKIAVDFGTSHSVVRWNAGGMQVSTLASRGTALGWNQPLTVRSTTPRPEYDSPWLLGSPAKEFEREQQADITFIPTGVYLRAGGIDAQSIADWRVTTADPNDKVPRKALGRLPFVDYCLMGPSMDFDTRSNVAMLAWRSGLKWSDDSGAAQAFLVALLVWATAVRMGAGGTVRFSAPLAFSDDKRRAFGLMLEDACRQAADLTGAPFSVAAPCFRSDETDGAARPFVDEATPVIWEVMRPLRTHEHAKGTGRQGVLVADLGGGTLDLLFASLEGKRGFRLLASESIQFGARAVIEIIDKRVRWSIASQGTVDTNLEKKLKEALLEQWTRTGELTRTILNTSRSSSAESDFVRPRTAQWVEPPRASATAILSKVSGYFFLIREYCARFVAGVLSSPDLRARFGSAPGSDEVEWNDDESLGLAIALTGNGWRFLPLAGFNPQAEQDAMEDSVRTSIRQRIGEYLKQQAPAAISLDSLSGLRKVITAQGMLNVDFTASDRGKTIEVAPNGCDDVKDTKPRHWGTFVSPAEPSYDLPGSQVIREVVPDVAGSTDEWFRMCVAARDAGDPFVKAKWFAPSVTEWNQLTERQGNADPRVMSTVRALWETVMRKKLDISPV
jgi:hypothetical protein